MSAKRSVTSPEFLLVVIMLLVLTALVYGVLWTPVNVGKGEIDASDIIEYKKTILTIIITAFGAWVGAGAAYYFGRENLRQASESLLAMREPSPRERLRKITVREIGPTPLKWTIKDSELIDAAVKKMKEDSDFWFVPIVKNDGSLETVVHEEAFWRYIHDRFESGSDKYGDTVKHKITDLLTYIRKIPGLARLDKIHVIANLDQSAGEVNEMMKDKGGFLAIIVDSDNKPTHYITTGDIRKVLMQMG
jgi:hypothetical protein